MKGRKAEEAGASLGYARVSKGDDQTDTSQIKALRAPGCRRLFEESASGGRWDRPELHRLLDQLREGDTVVVWKLDRLSRSLKDVLHIMERIAKAGAGFRSITLLVAGFSDRSNSGERRLNSRFFGLSSEPSQRRLE